MRFYAVLSGLLLLLCGFVVLGRGDRVEERFQGLPVVEGVHLIPPDEIPVVSVEKTREDAENIYWRLKADPIPRHGDLVVSVDISPLGISRGELGPLTFIGSIPQFENNSVEMRFERFFVEMEFKRYLDDEEDALFNGYTMNVTPLRNVIRLIIRDSYRRGIPLMPDQDSPPRAVVAMDLPPFQLDDGYVVPQGFKFSFYLPGEPLEMPR